MTNAINPDPDAPSSRKDKALMTTLNPRLIVLLVKRCALERITLPNSGSFLNFESRDIRDIVHKKHVAENKKPAEF